MEQVDAFLSIDHKAPKAWKCTSWSFTGNLCPLPAPELCCSTRQACTSSVSWLGRLLGTRDCGLYPRPTDKNLQIPGESLLTVQFEKHWFLEALLGSSGGCTLLQVQAARERTRGVAT